MIAAHRPVQRPPDARLLVVDPRGRITHARRSRFIDFLRPGDLVIANDAATLPASLHGLHLPSGAGIEVRLAARASLAATDIHAFTSVVFGAGDFHTRTEDRPLPPPLAPGDRLRLGSAATNHGEEPLMATVEALLDHPRLVRLRFGGPAHAVWAGFARHGRPIQYAHVSTPLEMWDVWTPIAGLPVAFEPPSASFALDWRSIRLMRERGIGFATITLAAGISSTGDPELDRRLPFDEPYRIPGTTAAAISRARAEGRRIIAVGTTVVRGLEHAAERDGLAARDESLASHRDGRGAPLSRRDDREYREYLREEQRSPRGCIARRMQPDFHHGLLVHPGDGIADQRIGPSSRLQLVDAILSGTHERGGSHYEILRAFLDDLTLARADAALEAHGYRTHEFGDSVLIEQMARAVKTVSDPRDCIAPAA